MDHISLLDTFGVTFTYILIWVESQPITISVLLINKTFELERQFVAIINVQPWSLSEGQVLPG